MVVAAVAECSPPVGVMAAGSIPQGWSLEFMATIAYSIAAGADGPCADAGGSSGGRRAGHLALRGMPAAGVIVAILCGIAARVFTAERWRGERTCRLRLDPVGLFILPGW